MELARPKIYSRTFGSFRDSEKFTPEKFEIPQGANGSQRECPGLEFGIFPGLFRDFFGIFPGIHGYLWEYSRQFLIKSRKILENPDKIPIKSRQFPESSGKSRKLGQSRQFLDNSQKKPEHFREPKMVTPKTPGKIRE